MASNGVPAPVAAVPAPKKKSLFNRRPKVTKPVATEEDDVDFFSRARDLFPQTIQDEERKKERRQARLERKRTTESVERKASKTPEVKRRRISELQDGHHSSDSSPLQEVDDDGAEMSFTHKSPNSSTLPQTASAKHKSQVSSNSLSERYSQGLSDRKKEDERKSATATAQVCITLTDSEDDVTYKPPAMNKSTSQAIEFDDDDDDPFSNELEKPIAIVEDDEPLFEEAYPELVERARKRQLEIQMALKKASSSEGKNSNGVEDVFGEKRIDIDPVVHILVTSSLPGAVPLVLRRKVSQRMKEVKQAWIDRQPPETIGADGHTIFLTWKGAKLYDVATCEHIGIRMGPDGLMNSDDLDGKGRLHLEAWTPASLEEWQRKEEEQRRKADVAAEPEPVREIKVDKVKLIFKAKGLEDIKTKLPVTHLVERLVQLFRTQHPEFADNDVWLMFDGERLDPTMMVKDTDLGEDLSEPDIVEVLIR